MENKILSLSEERDTENFMVWAPYFIDEENKPQGG